MKIEEVLGLLDELIKSEENFIWDFNPPADEDFIKRVETAFGIILPESYKTFLKRHNGGYITGIPMKTVKAGMDKETISWNSDVFMSIEEILEKYEDWKDMNWKLIDKFKGAYPYIPFCSTAEQEVLVFVNQGKRQEESAVYDAFHEEPVSCWGILSENFTSFLAEYIRSKGKPNLHSELEGNAGQLTDELNTKENLQEKILRARAYLSFYPGHSLSYNELGEAYEKLGDYPSAMENYSKCIEMDPKFGFYYYCRGRLLMNLGRYREALPDLDAAAILKSEDPFYLNSRAEVFIKLGKWELALKDCNKAISINPKYIFAYFNRFTIYLHLDQWQKAEEDNRTIDELMEENDY